MISHLGTRYAMSNVTPLVRSAAARKSLSSCMHRPCQSTHSPRRFLSGRRTQLPLYGALDTGKKSYVMYRVCA